MAAATESPAGRLALPLLATCLTLFAAFLLKEPCRDGQWGPGEPFGRHCYSDLAILYEGRQMDERLIPYVQVYVEYPPVIGLVMYATALMVDSIGGFVLANSILLAAAALLVTHRLAVASAKGSRVLRWAFGSSLLLYAFYNWDVLAVLLFVVSLIEASQGRYWRAGFAAGLGGATKIFPLLIVPAALILLLRAGQRRNASQVAGGAALGFALPHLPFLVLAPHGLFEAYRFHASRAPNIETPWFLLSYWGKENGVAWMDVFQSSQLILVVGIVALAGAIGLVARASARGTVGIPAASFLLLLAFVMVNKVFSLQYSLWLLPAFVLLPLRWTRFLAFWVVDVFMLLAMDALLDAQQAYRIGPALGWVAAGVAARLGLHAWLFVDVFRLSAASPALAAASGEPEDAAAPAA